MKTSRALMGALTVGAFAVASMFAAAPASAATLPSGQKITVVDNNTWAFSDASPVDAALTPVGDQYPVIPIDEYVEAVDVDDDGLGFALTTTYEPIDDPEECPPEEFCPVVYEATGATLYEANAATGVLSSPIDVQILTDPEDDESWEWASECLAIDYSSGSIIAACNIYVEGDGWTAYVGTVDPDTARLYPDVTLSGEGFERFQAIALDPINDVLWGFEDDEYGAYVISLETGEVFSPGDTEMGIYAADFDRDGVLWVSAYRPDEGPLRVIEPGEEGLAILSLEGDTAGDFTFDAAWSDPEAVINALTVWGKPALAATGSAVAPAAPAIVASGILLLGALLAAGTMVSRRRNAES